MRTLAGRLTLTVAGPLAAIAGAVVIGHGPADAATRSGTVKGTVERVVACFLAPCPNQAEPDARVVARRSGARTRWTTTDRRGRYSLRLPAGRWRVSVTAGERRDSRTIRLGAGRTRRVDLVLE